jgi:hypothetical protein
MLSYGSLVAKSRNSSTSKPVDEYRRSRFVKLRKTWTEDENQQLKAFVAQNLSVVRVAAVLKRSIIAVRSQARKLGTPFPPMKVFRRKWADTPSNHWRL